MNMIEIERKFLVNVFKYHNNNYTIIGKKNIVQGYLRKNENGSVRVRIVENFSQVSDQIIETNAYLMSKTKTDNEISFYETEDEISVENAKHLIDKFAINLVIKKRIVHLIDGFLWEVDHFIKPEEFILAEIELTDPDQKFTKPEWLGDEVTGIEKYYNANM